MTRDQTMRIAVIPGDGIGVDVTAEAVKVVRAVGETFGRTFDLEMLPYGADYYLRDGDQPSAKRLRDAPRRFRRHLHRGARRSAHSGHAPRARHPAAGPDSSSTCTSITGPVRLLARATVSPEGPRARPTSISSSSAKTPRASTSTSAGASSPAPKMRSPSRRRSTRTRACTGSSSMRSTMQRPAA